jgi:GNAT superfamily N-acetyltransferase
MKNSADKKIIITHDFRKEHIEEVVNLHKEIYENEYGYGKGFIDYVKEGLVEFFEKYDPKKDKVWICNSNSGEENKMIGFFLGMDRGESNQLRYFVIDAKYRGIGLGKKLMDEYIQWVKGSNYSSSYLWTTSELEAAGSLYKRSGYILTEEIESERFGKKVMEQKYYLKL